MSADLRFAAAAVALFALFGALGAAVSKRPLSRADAGAVYFRGQITRTALVFTISGRARAMTAACIAAIAAFALLHRSIAIPVVMAGSQLFSQIVVEWTKALFKRVRPDYWLVGLDAGHSYPSGHATTAMVFFVGWAVILAMGTLPLEIKYAGAAVLVLWAAAICWSRLALGAHYLSDVCGGVLFGAVWLCALSALSDHFHVALR